MFRASLVTLSIMVIGACGAADKKSAGSGTSTAVSSGTTAGAAGSGGGAAPGVNLLDVSRAIAVGTTGGGTAKLTDDGLELLDAGTFASLDAAGNISTATQNIQGTGGTTVQVQSQPPLQVLASSKAGNFLAMQLGSTGALMIPPKTNLGLDAFGNSACLFAYAPINGGPIQCMVDPNESAGSGAKLDLADTTAGGAIYTDQSAFYFQYVTGIRRFDPATGTLSLVYGGNASYLAVFVPGLFYVPGTPFHVQSLADATKKLDITDVARQMGAVTVGSTLVVSHQASGGGAITSLSVIDSNITKTDITLPAMPTQQMGNNVTLPVDGSIDYSVMKLCATANTAYGISGIYKMKPSVLTQVFPGSLKDTAQIQNGIAINACYAAGSKILLQRNAAWSLLDPTTGTETTVVSNFALPAGGAPTVTSSKIYLNNGTSLFIFDLASLTGTTQAVSLSAMTVLKQ